MGSPTNMKRTVFVLMTVGAVLALAYFVLRPVPAAREYAKRDHCKYNLRQIGLAFHNYHDTYKCFPPYAICDHEARPLLSWRVAILPFVEEHDLYRQFHLNEPWDSPHNFPLAQRMPSVYRCPTDASSKANASSYVVVTGPGTFFPIDSQTKIQDVKDGMSMTVMAGEYVPNNSPWTKPEVYSIDDSIVGAGRFSSSHSGGWHVLVGDGLCRFVDEKTDPMTLRAILSIAGGEQVHEHDF